MADALAKHAFCNESGLKEFMFPPRTIEELVWRDHVGHVIEHL